LQRGFQRVIEADWNRTTTGRVKKYAVVKSQMAPTEFRFGSPVIRKNE
jgi:hypothetical protein